MEFEWNERKREKNLRDHKVDFIDAALIFENQHFSKIDDREDYGEERWVSLGMVDGQVYVVVHTERDGVTRIISAWKGSTNERESYYARVFGGCSDP
ncbi:BrnT family toxin [Methylopila sp. M107]|uniref:BrnT family toxin n=1 Tax=Methylopila sp. M107 TaxID=1101190 RepID=UPI000365A46A|nr:BrnT family toxin [Methylopila sp. M107]